MRKSCNLVFQSDDQCEPIAITVDPCACDSTFGPTQGHLYDLSNAYSMTIEDIGRLYRLLLMHECPDISAIDAAELQRGGVLFKDTEDTREAE